MTSQVRVFAIMLVVTVLAAALAGWSGVRFGVREVRELDLDTALHQRLELTEAQDTRIHVLEQAFVLKRHGLQAEMHRANSDLAYAITHEHRYGPDAKRAVARFHRAMIALQEETIRHVLAMRSVLTPQQTHAFDAIITKSLADSKP